MSRTKPQHGRNAVHGAWASTPVAVTQQLLFPWGLMNVVTSTSTGSFIDAETYRWST